jgi:hypothetical protein
LIVDGFVKLLDLLTSDFIRRFFFGSLWWSVSCANLVCEVFEFLRYIFFLLGHKFLENFRLMSTIIVVKCLNMLVYVKLHFLLFLAHLSLLVLIKNSRVLISLLHKIGQFHVLEMLIHLVEIIHILLVPEVRLTIEALLLLLVAEVWRSHVLASHLVFEKLLPLSVVVEVIIAFVVHWSQVRRTHVHLSLHHVVPGARIHRRVPLRRIGSLKEPVLLIVHVGLEI